jgi:hypothetical protein
MNYNPMTPGSGFLGDYHDAAAYVCGTRGLRGLGDTAKLTVRPIPGALPGWPGFFKWLSTFSPELHTALRVQVPNLAYQQPYLNPAAMVSLPPGMHGWGSRSLYGRMGRMRGMRGLGQDGTVPDPSVDLSIPTYTPDLTTVDVPDVTLPEISAPLTSSPSLAASIGATITAAGQAILPLVQQQQLLAVNVARAKAGQPPLSLAAYQASTSGVNVGLNPSTQSFLITGALVVGGLFIVSKLLSRA